MKHQLATVALAPLLLLQGLAVRLRTPRLPEAAGPRMGVTGEGPVLRVLILGDSAGAGVGAEHQDEALAGQLVAPLAQHFQVSWRVFASTGATTASVLANLGQCARDPCDVVVTSLGVNDITRGTGLRKWLRQQALLRQRLHEEVGASFVVATALPPVGDFPALPQPLRWYLGARATMFNRALEEQMQDEAGSRYLNIDFDKDPAMMAADGFHPGPPVYQAWGAGAAAMITAQFA